MDPFYYRRMVNCQRFSSRYQDQSRILCHSLHSRAFDGWFHSVRATLIHELVRVALTVDNRDAVLWLTYFFKSNELPTRLAWFWTALSTCNIVGSLLAAGILNMRGLNGWSGWQYL